MSEATQTTTEADEELKKLVRAAAGIVVGSGKVVGISKAMQYVGFTEEQRKSMTLYQRVRRLTSNLVLVNTKEKVATPVPNLEGAATESIASTLTNSGPKESSSTSTPEDEDEDESPGISSVRRRLPLATMNSPSCSNSSNQKKTRRTSKELQRHNACIAAGKNQSKIALKRATTLIHKSQLLPKSHPERQTAAEIVRVTNKIYNTTITAKTATRYVRDGMIGQSPLKRGPVGDIPKAGYTALKGAFVSYLKLEQAESKKQSAVRDLSKLVNATVNAAGLNKTRDDLTRKLQRDTADIFEVGKANTVEQRRVQWTTAYNLNVWFDNWKANLVELGFAAEPEDEIHNGEGELQFYAGQMDRILNLDETDGSIDDTTGQRGGRPPMVFHAPDVAGGATAVNKSGYSSTIICGSTASGDPLPPHFQLKTLAKLEENQRLSIDWFQCTKRVVGRFGFEEIRDVPCSFGMNERAGMNAVELDKYITNAILPLYPDVEDKAGKRVIIKADSGPGRANVEMLAKLRLQGVYLFTGVPNTTGKTQETDQNYGPFKSAYRKNIRSLSQARFERGLNLQVTDLPLLVFGGTCLKTGVNLSDSFSAAFSVESNLSCWRKCGAVPLTRAPLKSKDIRREIPIGDAAALVAGVTEEAEVKRLRDLENMNQFYCNILFSLGYDGSKLTKKAPRRSRYVAVTKPESKERVAALKNAKTAGQVFYATGGRHINTDEFFVANEQKSREAQIKKMEDLKKERAKYCKEQKGAVLMIRDKGELTHETERNFTTKEIQTLLKWKKVKATSARKRDLVDAYVAAPKPKIQKKWCNSEEAALLKLKEENIPVKETAIGVAATQMARAVTNNLVNLDEETINSLKTALDMHTTIKEETPGGNNVI